jgi:transposase
MAISLPDARQLSDEVLEALRLRALRGRELGLSETDLAYLLGVSHETICRWWTAYVAGGLDALPRERSGRPPGSGRLLSEGQARRVQRLLDEHTPEDLGIAAPLWSRRAVRDLIEQECGVRLAVRTVGVYLRRWGYTAKKPRRHSRQQQPEEVRRWLDETYPALEQRAEAEGATVFWCDETGVAADEYPARGYAREGQPATLTVPGPHIRMNQVSAISNAGEVRFLTYPGTMTAALFLLFLGRLLRSTTGKIFLIVDRLTAHEKAEAAAWTAAHADRLELIYLPCHAPELNADEYLNNDLKANVHAEGLPDDKHQLRSRMQTFMRQLIHLPQHVINYFKHPCVQYAAGM